MKSCTELMKTLKRRALEGDVHSLCFAYLLNELVPGDRTTSFVLRLEPSREVDVKVLEGDELNGIVVRFPSGRKYFLAETGLLMEHLDNGDTSTLYNPMLEAATA